MTKKLFLSLVLCLSLLGTINPVLAQADVKPGEDILVKLQREGWKIVNEGVLQRELKPGKIESFVFGVPGFTWQIQDLRRQLKELQDEFRAHPTPELRKAIASHRKVIASAQQTLEVARTYEALGENGVLKESCITSSSSAHAAVGSKEDVQGVWAEASAAYSGDCEAQIYAYAFSKAGINGEDGPGSMRFDGPRSAAGGPTDLLYVESNGGAPCEARAYSYVSLPGIYPPIAESEKSTMECPSPLDVTVTSDAPSATIDLYNSDCITINWTANISGGTSPYSSTMYLNGVSQGEGPTYSETWCNAETNSSTTLNASATVTDSGNPARSKSASAPAITIRSHVKTLDVTVTSDAPSTTIDLYNSDCITITWTTNISGGTSPYISTMYLNGAFPSTRTVFTGTSCNNGTNSSQTFTVSSTVKDSGNPVQSKSASAPTITIRSHPKPLDVTVTSNAPSTTIDLYNSDCITVDWTTNISGGASPYASTMYLNGTALEAPRRETSRTSYSNRYCNAGTNTSLTATVSATVTDDSNQSKSASAPTITIRSHVKPLAVTVTSSAPSTIVDLYNSDCITITWSTNISGGTSPYSSTMYLNNVSQGVRTTYSKSYCNAKTNTSLTASTRATVTDSGSPVQSQSASAPTITIRSHVVAVSPLAVTVTSNAPSTIINLYEYDCVAITWTTNISGGTSPYSSTMSLNGVSKGVRTTYSGTWCNAQTNSSATLSVSSTVTDSSSPVQSKSASAPTITIQSHYYKEPVCYLVYPGGKAVAPIPICP